MMRLSKFVVPLVLCLGTFVRGQATFSQPGLFELNVKIPESTASLDNGDVEFTIQAPANAGWTAVGIGKQMLGSLILVLYPGPDGTNVTVSPRLGQGEVEPRFYPQTGILLRDGSGISNGLMTAVFTCQNCKRWAGGSLDVTNTNQNWIFASNPDNNLRTSDTQATLLQHSDSGYGLFTMDMTKAVLPDAQASAPASLNSGGSASTGSGSSGTLITNNSLTDKKTTFIIIHAVVMGFAFVILFPFGAFMIRVLRHIMRRSFYLHVVIQLLTYLLAIAGLVLGVMASSVTNSHFIHSHQILGVVIIAFLFLQIVFGVSHHIAFRMKAKRTWISYVHIWFGRLCIVLGIVNGALGLPLAGADAPEKAIYAGIAAFVAVIWFVGYAAVKFLEHTMGVGKKDKDEDVVVPKIYKPAVYEMKTSPTTHQATDVTSASEDNFGDPNTSHHSKVYAPSAETGNYSHPNIYTPQSYVAQIGTPNPDSLSTYQPRLPYSHV